MNVTTKENNLLLAALPAVADGAALIVALLLLPALAVQLQAPSGWNALLLVVLYVLLCVGVYALRKLAPAENGRWSPPGWFMDRRVRGVLALLFGLLMMTTVAYQLGFFEAVRLLSLGDLEEGSTAAFYVFAPGAWLGFSMLYILLLAFTVRPTVAPHSERYAPLALLGLLLVNGMFLLATAQARAIFLGSGLSQAAVFLVTLLLLAVSFLPPRLIYQSRRPQPVGLLSIGVLLLVSAWWVTA